MADKTTTSAVATVNAITNTAAKSSGYNFPLIDADGNNFKDLASELRRAPEIGKNSWIDTLFDLAVKQVSMNKRAYESYFRKLRKGVTNSKNLQLFMVNLAKAKNYDPKADMDDYFEDEIPDVDNQYISHLDKKKFAQSYNDDNVITALTSAESFMNLLAGIELAMYNAMEMYDVSATKATIEGAIEDGNVYLYPIARPVDKDTSLAFTAAVKQLGDDLSIEMNNAYSANHGDTITPKDDAFLLLTTDISAIAETFSLPFMFDKSLADLSSQGLFMKIPSNGLCDGKVYGMYADKDAIQIYDFEGFPKVASQYFGNTLTNKRWLHYWAVYAYNYLVNSIAFCNSDAIGIDSVSIEARNGSVNANRGEVKKFDVKVVATEGKLADIFGTFEIEGATDENTFINVNSGTLTIGKNETGTSGKITVKFTSHLDSTKTATVDITINQ